MSRHLLGKAVIDLPIETDRYLLGVTYLLPWNLSLPDRILGRVPGWTLSNTLKKSSDTKILVALSLGSLCVDPPCGLWESDRVGAMTSLAFNIHEDGLSL